MSFAVTALRRTQRFDADLRDAPADIQAAARQALGQLLQDPREVSLRVHPLKGVGKPTVFKLEILKNRSWQVSFVMNGHEAVLRRLGAH